MKLLNMNKHLLGAIIATFCCFSTWAQSFSGGSGTAADPYLISSVADLKAINDLTNSPGNAQGKHFKLTQDITEPFTGFIGTEGIFKGHFDGNGHSIMLNIETTESYIGLFGTTVGATIKNLIVEGTVKAGMAAAAVVGNPSSGTVIENVVNYANVTGGSFTGGIAGYIVSQKKYGNTGATLRNCVNYGHIIGKSCTGGVVGYSGQQLANTLERLVNYGHVESSDSRTGGIVGNPLYDDAINCLLNMGTISSPTISGVLGNGNPKKLSEVFYDGQYSPTKFVIPEQRKLTADILGDKMKSDEPNSLFNTNYWLFEENMLPRLKINGQENSMRAILYATPLVLDADNTVDSITSNFKVGVTHDVTWTAKHGLVKIHPDGTVKVQKTGIELLTASCGQFSRTFKLNIVKANKPKDVNDVTALINTILKNNTIHDVTDEDDYNKDGVIDISDVTELINIILLQDN